MENILISDVTLRQASQSQDIVLSFREKIELAKLLDRLGIAVIEADYLSGSKTDFLLTKSIASAVKESVVAVPVQLDGSNIDEVWRALQEAKQPRLQVISPVSPVQMEYLTRLKPDDVLAQVRSTVAACAERCPDVEFVADDATRSDRDFLYRVLEDVIASGATRVTLCDTAGSMLPDEFEKFLLAVQAAVPALATVQLGIACADNLSMADACAVAALRLGAREIKAAACPVNAVSIANIAQLIAAKGDQFGVRSGIRITELQRILTQIEWLCQSQSDRRSPFDRVPAAEETSFLALDASESLETVLKSAAQLGYDLSPEDGLQVFEAFQVIAGKKGQVTRRELDAIVATAANQVPPTYQLEDYVVTTGNSISASAHLKLRRHDQPLEGISLGDGPIDAAIIAIEHIIGRHYELDDFQIQSITEGQSAMGETLVKLRSNGKLYSGRGISTDIVGSSIQAYLNAVNKIAHEEDSV